jgi:5-methyltetrahydrofolate--homocysteine methyltransferase
MVGMGREQVKEGAHVLDVCTAFVGRDEVTEMGAVVERFVRDVPAPLCIDTTEPPVVQAALERIGGRAVVNSVNLEDGGERLREILPLVKEHGAALICLCIDEEGMARTADRKVEVARRILDIVSGEYGLRPQDLLFDALTFTLGSGDEEFRSAGVETLEGVRRIREEIPGAFTLLGVSNISFGLKPAARVVLNSVFLHEAMRHGLDAAIVHAGKILPLNRFSDEERELARRIVHDQRRPDSDPLTEFMSLFEEEGTGRFAARGAERSETVEEELRRRIVEGAREGLEDALDRAMQSREPLSIINDVLLEGMREVGDLFATGEMQLPFVLQSAETMKTAVSHLEPRMEREEGREKGTIVLATVRGDVHDIGKNLVDIILSNNGYRTVNLGIKVPVSDVIDAAREHRADAIGLSGLLVKSTVIMREDLEELNRQGRTWPVLLGGAALTRRYVEGELRGVYDGQVHYARDAFEGLTLMDRIREEGPPAAASRAPRKAAAPRPSAGAPAEPLAAVEGRSPVSTGVPVPEPPFLGPRIVREVPLGEVWPYLNETALFRGQWQFRGGKLTREEHEAFLDGTARPILKEWKSRCEKEGLLRPAVAYGYWRCRAEGDELVVLEGEGERELVRLAFPRQPARDRLCLADFFRPGESGELDTVAFTLVTVGPEAGRAARELFEADRYRDYLFLHGLGVEAVEALAERWHQRVREELGIAGEDAAREADILSGKADPAAVRDLLRQRYRGSRYSLGYPACPDLEQQEQLRALLPFDEIGVTLTESWQLDPEQSTTAIVCHHPEARYFRVD